MGLLVPMYAYYSARGTDDNRMKGKGKLNNDNKDMLSAFFNLLRDPLVREIGIKCRAVYPREENADIRKINWEGSAVYEIETEGRPRLEALMDKLDDRGTIVIPDAKHLTADNVHASRLIKRLCEGSLAPIALDVLQDTIQPLKEIFQNQQPGRLPHDIEKRIKKFFNALTSDAVRVRQTVENSRLRKEFQAVPQFER